MGEKSSCYVFPYSKKWKLEEESLNTMTKCSKERLRRKGVRVVPGASARYGSFISSGIMMQVM
jgi:tetrahydrodipicolinate N-succinyltransferase